MAICTCGRPLSQLAKGKWACRSCGKTWGASSYGPGWLELLRDPLALPWEPPGAMMGG